MNFQADISSFLPKDGGLWRFFSQHQFCSTGWVQLCAPMWKRSEKLEFPTGMMFTSTFRKAKVPPPRPFVIIYSATVLRGGRSGPQDAGCCVTRRAELVCLEKEVRLQCPGGVICLCSAWGSVVKTLSEPQSPEAQPASSSSPCVPERCCFIIPILLWARFFP